MKKSGDNTHLCKSTTPTVNGCDLTPSTQQAEQECSDLTVSNIESSTPHTPQKFFSGEPFIFWRRGGTLFLYSCCDLSQGRNLLPWDCGRQWRYNVC